MNIPLKAVSQKKHGFNPRGGWKLSVCLPLAIVVVLIGTVLVIWSWQNTRENARLETARISLVRLVQSSIVRDLDARTSLLQRLADRWTYGSGMSQEHWNADAAKFFQNDDGFRIVARVDVSLHPRWHFPKEAVQGTDWIDIADNPTTLQAMQTARDERRLVMLPIELAVGEDELIVFTPVYRDGHFDGLMALVLQLDEWLDGLIEAHPFLDIGVYLEGRRVYESTGKAFAFKEGNSEATAVTEHVLPWVIQVQRASSAETVGFLHVKVVLLILGVAVSCLFAWLVRAHVLLKEQSEQLAWRTRELDKVWQNMPGMAFWGDMDSLTSIEDVSVGCQALSGYTKNAFEQGLIRWRDLVHPDDALQRREAITQACRAGGDYSLEYRIVSMDGQEKWVMERGRVTPALHGGPDQVDGLILDISEQKYAESAANEASAFSTAVVNAAAEAVISIDMDGGIRSVNRSAQEMFAYTQSEFLQADVRMLMPDKLLAEFEDHMRRYSEAGDLSVFGGTRDAMAKRHDGSTFPIRLSVSEMRVNDEPYLVGLVRDMSIQHAAELDARNSREQLAQVDRVNELGEMATGIAHEINQPLSAISMYAQSCLRFLDSANPSPERLRDALEKLSKQAHRAGAVIERMQEFTRQRDLQDEDIDVNELLQGVARLAAPECHFRNMLIELDPDPDKYSVKGNLVQLQQVILKLIRNGMDSMDSVDHRYGNRIVLRARAESSQVVFDVIDQGAGVSDSAAENLYEPFESSRKRGLGMGLTICKTIVHAHGGQLEYVNNDDCGASFRFTVPCVTHENT